MHLCHLCHINSGYTTTRRLEPAPADGLPAIQLGDLHGDAPIRAETLYRYKFETRPPDRYLVQGGEVLFKSRGDPSIASVVSTTLVEPAVVILPLLILRPRQELVRGDYLAWAVNQPDAQRRLNREAQGTSLRMVPKTVLERLDVPLPDLDTQGRIAAIHALTQQEGRLLHTLAHRRQQRTGLMLRERATLTQHHAND
ncbi:MAG: restriction endonuclease subunit S [Synechococcus sp. SB0668_bin_15]|nr:restriction endonuclease subunit S [Synechococcus sp. SB0668_bin_15]MYC48753.1 restriction endonuclease subunit S [Synechococcus sp. SB0662_bin_14]